MSEAPQLTKYMKQLNCERINRRRLLRMLLLMFVAPILIGVPLLGLLDTPRHQSRRVPPRHLPTESGTQWKTVAVVVGPCLFGYLAEFLIRRRDLRRFRAKVTQPSYLLASWFCPRERWKEFKGRPGGWREAAFLWLKYDDGVTIEVFSSGVRLGGRIFQSWSAADPGALGASFRLGDVLTKTNPDILTFMIKIEGYRVSDIIKTSVPYNPATDQAEVDKVLAWFHAEPDQGCFDV
jgi:hypothetical protein